MGYVDFLLKKVLFDLEFYQGKVLTSLWRKFSLLNLNVRVYSVDLNSVWIMDKVGLSFTSWKVWFSNGSGFRMPTVFPEKKLISLQFGERVSKLAWLPFQESTPITIWFGTRVLYNLSDSGDLNNGQGHSKIRQDSKGLYLKETRCSLLLQLGGSRFEFGTMRKAIQIPDKKTV